MRRFIPLLLLLALTAFHGINNFIWLHLDQQIPFDDDATHLAWALQCLEILKQPSWDIIGQLLNLKIHSFYPPFFHVCMAIFNLFLGPSMNVSLMANLPFIALLLFSTYAIGKEIDGRQTGFLAAFLVMMYPYVFGLSKMSLPDFAMMAILAFSVYCLIKTEYFSKRTFSVILGISMGLGMLTKQVYIVFILVPFLLILSGFIRKKKYRERGNLTNLFFCLFLFVILSMPWYVLHFDVLKREYSIAAVEMGPLFGPPTIFSMESFIFYFNSLYKELMLFPLFFLFLVGFFFFLFFEKSYWKGLLLSSIGGPYLIFFLINTKEYKTITPILIFIALITAIGLLKTKQRVFFRSVIVCGIVCFGLLQYYFIRYYSPTHAACFKKIPLGDVFVSVVEVPHPITINQHYMMKRDYPLDEIFSLIRQEQERDKDLLVGITGMLGVASRLRNVEWKDSYAVTNEACYAYFSSFYGLPHEFLCLEGLNKMRDWWKNSRDMPDLLLTGDDMEWKISQQLYSQYQLIKTFLMPDHSLIYVYKKNNDGSLDDGGRS